MVMKEFDSILKEATKAISSEYFQLQIAGRGDPSYRERVYCYELYHQMRLRWPEGFQYSLSGEVDKSGHPLIRGNKLDRIKPDFLVHIPGHMGNNELVMEIKPVNGKPQGIIKDLETLTAFRCKALYKRAILLFYGSGERESENLIKKVAALTDQSGGSISLEKIELWHHASPGYEAKFLGNDYPQRS